MSGGPPHHTPHGRQAPTANTAWNHLQVPNYYGRQPQHAHMSNEHPILHQPTWHTPTTEPVKPVTHSHIFNLEQMITDRQYSRHSPGVDLTLQRNGQNGEVPSTTPISLSVRDAKQINSLPVTAIEIQTSKLGQKNSKRSTKRVDSIIERLNPIVEKEKLDSVIVPSNQEDITTSTTANPRDEDVVSPFSNEDSTDSCKSRRKRKPTRTVRVAKELEEQRFEIPVETTSNKIEEIVVKIEEPDEDYPVERRRSESAPPGSPPEMRTVRRKTSSESETIDNIAAMINYNNSKKESVIKSVINPSNEKEECEVTSTPLNVLNETNTTKTSNDSTNSFVEVENKLEEMFAGIADEPEKRQEFDDNKGLELDENVLKLDENRSILPIDSVTSTSNDLTQQKIVRNRKSSDRSTKRKKTNKKSKSSNDTKTKLASKTKKKNKVDAIKDVYSYDSGSNASSSRSRGPFVHIRGNRDSPLSVNIINTPVSEEDSEKKPHKPKKYHDDSEYRHKVRSKGLHCSTLSNKYDAQTRDATWICVFCKRGPHATDPNLSGPSRFLLDAPIHPPGDLFGPYTITTKSSEYQRRFTDPYDRQFRSKKVARAIDASNTSTSSTPKLKKIKRKHSETFDTSDDPDSFLGITESNGNYEVWAHEDCIVWAPGLHLVGPKIVGLEEAVWGCCNVACGTCKLKGANVCCVQRGCTDVMHFGCALSAKWSLNDETFKAFCAAHKTH